MAVPKPELSVDDVYETIAEQIQKLRAKTVKTSDIATANAIANQIGKGLKAAALQIKYTELKNTAAGKNMSVPIVEPRKK